MKMIRPTVVSISLEMRFRRRASRVRRTLILACRLIALASYAISASSKSRNTLPSPFSPVLIQGQVIGTQNHILRGHGYRTSVGGLEQVAGRQHQEPGLGLGLSGQRHVNSHLVAVKVGVVSGTDQRDAVSMARPSTSTGSKA